MHRLKLSSCPTLFAGRIHEQRQQIRQMSLTGLVGWLFLIYGFDERLQHSMICSTRPKNLSNSDLATVAPSCHGEDGEEMYSYPDAIISASHVWYFITPRVSSQSLP